MLLSLCTLIYVIEINLDNFCLVLIFYVNPWKVMSFGEQCLNLPQKVGFLLNA